MNDKDIIEKLGRKVISEDLSVGITTVGCWASERGIPGKHRWAVYNLAQSLGIILPRTFMDNPEEWKPQRKQKASNSVMAPKPVSSGAKPQEKHAERIRKIVRDYKEYGLTAEIVGKKYDMTARQVRNIARSYNG